MTLQELEAKVEVAGYSGLTSDELAELLAHRTGATVSVLNAPSKKVPAQPKKEAGGQTLVVDQFAQDDDGA